MVMMWCVCTIVVYYIHVEDVMHMLPARIHSVTHTSFCIHFPSTLRQVLHQITKAIKRRALDVVHGLGLSDSLLRVIDKRQRTDKVILLGGMVCVCVACVCVRGHNPSFISCCSCLVLVLFLTLVLFPTIVSYYCVEASGGLSLLVGENSSFPA